MATGGAGLATAGGAGLATAGGAGAAAAGGAGRAATGGAGTAAPCGPGTEPTGGVQYMDVAADKGATLGSGAAPSARTEGMDPNSTYLLKIRLIPNPKKARKEIKSFCFETVIDSDLTNYKDLLEEIVEKYPPRYLEVAHLQYYDDVLKIYPEVNSDQELMSMFEKHSQKKVVQMFIAYCDPDEPYEPITVYDSEVLIQPKDKIDQDDESYLRNPIPENEHVGIDEENAYLEKEPMPLNVVLFSEKKKDTDFVPEDESDDESEGGSEYESEDEPEIEEDEEVHEADHAPNVEYNKEDPPMTEGSTYPNMAVFKLALSQHAVKHEFEYSTEKSTPHRFRGYCKRKDEDDCPWRIHASTTDDLCTVVVRKNPYEHDCSSAQRLEKVQNATKSWICEKVKDWLIEDATLGARELQKKLKEHHKVKIHYKRVYMGKLLALKQLYGDWDNSFDNLYRSGRRPWMENSSGKKGKGGKSGSGGSRTGSRQPELPVKVKAKKKKKEVAVPKVPLDSPAMGTRSKKFNPRSPAMSTRSKRRLSL